MKVNDAADKIASDTQTYRDVLAQGLAAVVSKFALDPRVLGNMECKAWQILIDIFNEEGNNTLAKSLTELVVKANEAIGRIEDIDKPDKVIVESTLQTYKGRLVMTLNSKEARQPAGRPEDEIVLEAHECSNWLEKIADQLIREATNDRQATPGAGRPN